jgi:hypothetical protein
LDASHIEDTREGRYERAAQSLNRILAMGTPIGFRTFRRQENYDVCYLVVWLLKEYEEFGQYMVFRAFFSKQNYDFHLKGYRKLLTAEIACFYDGQYPNPGRILRTHEDAVACMLQKDGYYECI